MRIRVAIAIAAVVIATTLALAFRPSIAVAVATALSLSVLAWFAPRTFIGVGLLLIVLSSTLRLVLPDQSFNLVDEIVVVVAVLVLIARRAFRGRLPAIPPWSLWFAGFFAAGLLSALINSVPTPIAFEGAFLAAKALLFGVGVAQIDWRASDLKPFVIGGAAVTVGIFIVSLVNLISPTWWTSLILGRDAEFTGELGLPALIGPFEHPAALGRICALLAIAIVCYRLQVGGGWKNLALLAMAALPALASFRVKTIVSLIVSVIGVAALNISRISRAVIIGAVVIAVVIAVPVVNFVAADVVHYLINESARSIMTTGSFDVAAQHFPLGAGFGRYGSYTASVNYSPEYVRLGFDTVYGLRSTPNGGQYLNDTQWPAIIGEAGWLGAALFAAGIVHIGVDFLRRTPAGIAPLEAWIRLTGIGWLIIIVVESIGAPVFTSAPAYPLPFVAAGIYFALRSAPSDAELTKPALIKEPA